MAIPEQSLTPDEIRSIREFLRLSQVEAGEIVGGGPNAFAKYESGTVKPSAAVLKLLQLLEARPELLHDVGGEASIPATYVASLPFAVTGDDISDLEQRQIPNLLRLLLTAEARAYNLPADGIHVASNIYAPDGGEDGRMTWSGGPGRTPFLPARLNQFQMKSSAIAPAAAGRDVLTTRGSVKDMVSSILAESGTYIMLCAHSYTGKQIELRKAKIREAIRNGGISIDDCQVDFRDSDQIATWINDHPSVAMWVREQVRPGGIGPFRSWDHWSGRPQHQQSPWVADERLPGLSDELRESIRDDRKVVRVVGLSGIGKSRLVLESLSQSRDRDFVMYASESESGSEALCRVVQILAGSGRTAIVVVDDCGPDTHRMLASMVLSLSSRLSLVTIDNQTSIGTLEDTTVEVREAPASVIEALVDRVSPGLQSEDRRRLIRLAAGFPAVALRIGRAWTMGVPVSKAVDQPVDRYVLGRQPWEPTLLLKSAKLIAAFGMVALEPVHDNRLEEVARLGRDLSADDLRAAVVDLGERSVAQRRGRFALLQPPPIALSLAERQWREWSKNTWDDVLSGSVSVDLRKGAARQLVQLNDREIAHEVVKYVCRFGGPFDQSQRILQTDQAEVLSSLAEIEPGRVVYLIERLLCRLPDLSMLVGNARGHLLEALGKIAFHSGTFEEGTKVLVQLAASEMAPGVTGFNDRLSPLLAGRRASEQFSALFPVLLGKTEANGDKRLAFLAEVASTDDPAQREAVVQALMAGTELRHFSRLVGVETQGSRPALESWRPKTDAELVSYVKGCVKLLADMAVQNDRAGNMARDGLASLLSTLVLEGFVDTVEAVVLNVAASVDYWPGALRSLEAMLSLNAERVGANDLDRVRSLVGDLRPKTLESETRVLITQGLWEDAWDTELDYETRERSKRTAVRSLVTRLLDEPAILTARLPELSCGRQFMAREFGEALACCSMTPADWLEPIVKAVVETPESDRNFDILSGFASSLADIEHDATEAFKQRAALSSDLSPVFPRLCLRTGISADDIQLAINAIRSGQLRPLSLNRWAVQGVFDCVSASEVAALLDVLTEHSAESFAVAILLLGVHCSDRVERIDRFLPQVIGLAEKANRWEPEVIQDPQDIWGDPEMFHYHFERIVGHILDRGSGDATANEMAQALITTLVDCDEHNSGLVTKPILSRLLADFAEVAWPHIGRASVSDRGQRVRFEYILGDQFAIGRQPDPLILKLPEEILLGWCHDNPDHAPAFTARVIPLLTADQVGVDTWSLHPVMSLLLDEFGDRDDVQQAVGRNIHTFGWYGSRATYFTHFEKPLDKLRSHPKLKVRLWARRLLRELHDHLDTARNQDAERQSQWEA